MSAPVIAGETDLWIESRGVDIPVTLVMPDDTDSGEFPLVVLAHGHGGTRHENGGFTQLASMLAEKGIASIRMDFPGCGDSTEAFIHNHITNMLQDIEAALSFAASRTGIDSKRVGILGYSMGGRLAMLTGQSLHVTQWGQEQLLGEQWFVDMDSTRPLDAISNFEGADHGFGFFSPDPVSRDALLSSTAGFFADYLLRSD